MKITIVGAFLIVAAVAAGAFLLFALTENTTGPSNQQNGGSPQ